MQLFRMKQSDIEGIQIDKEYQQFLQNEHGIPSNIGDYFYKDHCGNLRVMEKEKFERLFAPVPDLVVEELNPKWFTKIIPKALLV